MMKAIYFLLLTTLLPSIFSCGHRTDDDALAQCTFLKKEGVFLKILSGDGQKVSSEQPTKRDVVFQVLFEEKPIPDIEVLFSIEASYADDPTKGCEGEVGALTNKKGKTDKDGKVSTRIHFDEIDGCQVGLRAKIEYESCDAEDYFKENQLTLSKKAKFVVESLHKNYLAITTQHNGTEKAGQPFTLLLEVMTEKENKKGNFNRKVQLGFTLSSETPSPNNFTSVIPKEKEVTFVNGEATVFNTELGGEVLTGERLASLKDHAIFFNTKEKPTIIVDAPHGEFKPSSSAQIIVTPGSLDKIEIMSGASGGGEVLEELSFYPKLGLYAVAFDSFGNYIEDVKASWSVSLGNQENLKLPKSYTESSFLEKALSSINGTKTFLQPVAPASFYVEAEFGGFTAVTGLLTALSGMTSSFKLTTEHDNKETAGRAFRMKITIVDLEELPVLDFNQLLKVQLTLEGNNSPNGSKPSFPEKSMEIQFQNGVAFTPEMNADKFMLPEAGIQNKVTISHASYVDPSTNEEVIIGGSELSGIEVEADELSTLELYRKNNDGSETVLNETNFEVTGDDNFKIYSRGLDPSGNLIGLFNAIWAFESIKGKSDIPVSSLSDSSTPEDNKWFHPVGLGQGILTLSYNNQILGKTGTITARSGAPARFTLKTEHQNIESANSYFKLHFTAYDANENMALDFNENTPVQLVFSNVPASSLIGTDSIVNGSVYVEYISFESGLSAQVSIKMGGVSGNPAPSVQATFVDLGHKVASINSILVQ